MAGVSYLLREEPERKEQRRLRALGTENIQKGDFDLAIKYYSESFEVIKDVMSPIDTIHEACDYATRWEILQQYEAALPYYQTAMKRLKAVEPISDRCVEGVMLMDRMAQCYHRTGRHETAEKMFKQAIRLYEKYHGEFSASNSSGSNGSVAAKLEGEIINVFLHYAQLLVSVKRDNEVADMRQRFTQIVRGSQLLRSMETTLLEKFDDLMALYAIREKRRRRRDGEERTCRQARRGADPQAPTVFIPGFGGTACADGYSDRCVVQCYSRCGRWDGFYVSKKSVKITLVLGTARNAKSKHDFIALEKIRKEWKLVCFQTRFTSRKRMINQLQREETKSFKQLKNSLRETSGARRRGGSRHLHRERKKGDFDLATKGRHETADKFKQAISLYEKYRGEFSVSSSSGSNGRVVGKLDGVIVIMFLHYAQLLAAMERGNEVTDMRQSLTQIVRDSSWLWSLETAILDQFDDLVVQAIRGKRRRGEGHDMMLGRMAARRGLLLPRRVQQAAPASAAPIRALSNARDGRSDGFYVSKKAVKMTLVLGAALTGALLYLVRRASYPLKFTEAIPFYTEALKNVALETRLVHCEDLRVLMLDRLGQCYKQTGDPEAAVEHFKQAIEATS
ncbi:Tetratricopeptide repeat [Phytophthora cactorum]|nr:Tetratricopeptide repeat [Phytophthora cactorum]